ncbi:MAG: GntR family transcriptional regulator [Opitutaceae bacterium]|jgi:DNA-binding LacI/PurR family transcriptional regulator
MQTDAHNKAEFVFSALEKRITSGFWKIGDQIPTEAELSAEFKCSRGTVGRAIARLAHEKLVERRTRAGTRVIQNTNGRSTPALDLDACAFIYPSIQHEGISRIVAGFQEAANTARQRTMMLTTGTDFRKEAEIVGRLGEFNVRGAVIYPVISSPQDQIYYMQMILTCPYPVVLVGVNLPGVGRPGVVADGQHAGYTMTKRLLDQGARKIGFLANYAWVPSVRDRYLGYRQAMSEAGLGDGQEYVQLEAKMTPRFDNPLEEPTMLARSYFKKHPDVEGVVCADDFLAHGCLHVALELGLAVPGRVKIAGIGDFRLLPQTTPALTTYHAPFEQMGRRSFEMLMATIKDPTLGASEALVRGEIVVRESA